ncbi:MAG: hypothetical protein J6Z01_01050 [Bacteroidales bacterium]|nr:hypothetical protein [Bacteroidales bacterium]
MNKTLAVFVNDDYLTAAIQPLKDKFSLLFTNDEKKFPFYFYINPTDSSIDYGFDYKINFRDNKSLFAGDLMLALDKGGQKISIGGFDEDYIALFNPIIRDIRELFGREMSKYEEFQFSDTTVIDTAIVFSENITPKAQTAFLNYWKSKCFNFVKVEKFDTLLLQYYKAKNRLYCQNRKFAVLEALGMDLNMSVINVDGANVSRLAFKKFEGYGIDPRIKVIAKKIVDDVNRQENIIDREDNDAINREYIRHYDKAVKIVELLATWTKPVISLQTSFAVNQGNKIKVSLSVDEINKLSYLYSRQFSAFFSDNFLAKEKIKTIDLDKIFLVGNSLNNSTVLKEFATYGETKIEEFTDDISYVLSELFKEEPAPAEVDEESTMFQMGAQHVDKPQPPAQPKTVAPPPPSVQPAYRAVDNINLQTLTPNQKVLLNTFDPAPGKGAAHQEFVYIGNHQFKVLSSSRTLRAGDLAEPVSDIWQNGVQIDLMITRNGKNLGRFRTRPVVKISIM